MLIQYLLNLIKWLINVNNQLLVLGSVLASLQELLHLELYFCETQHLLAENEWVKLT